MLFKGRSLTCVLHETSNMKIQTNAKKHKQQICSTQSKHFSFLTVTILRSCSLTTFVVLIDLVYNSGSMHPFINKTCSRQLNIGIPL